MESVELKRLASDTARIISELGARFNAAIMHAIHKINNEPHLTRENVMRTLTETCDDVIDGTNVVRIKAQALVTSA